MGKDTRIVSNTYLYDFLRNYDESLKPLADSSVSALLRFVEQLGEVLLVSGSDTSRDKLVVLDPHWFFCDVIGSFFRYEYFKHRKDMIQTIDTIRKHLILHGSDELEQYTDDVIAILHQMRLCVPMPRSDHCVDHWFMSFMEHHKFAEVHDMGLSYQELFIEDFWKRCANFFSDFDFIYSGRLISPISLENSSQSWNHFLPGSFSRFQMLVVENFWTLTQDPSQLYILTVSPFRLSLSYQSKVERVEIFVQMMFDQEIEMPICCRMWLKASSENACKKLFGNQNFPLHYEDQRMDFLVVDRVFQQFLDWFKSACMVSGCGPKLYFYCISPDATGKKHEDIFQSYERKKFFFDFSASRKNLERNPANEIFYTRLCGERNRKSLQVALNGGNNEKTGILDKILDQLKHLQEIIKEIMQDKNNHKI